MESTALKESGQRQSQAFIDINYPIPIEYRPVAQTIPTGGSAQWAILGTAGTADSVDATVVIGTCERVYGGKFDGMNVGGVVDIAVTADFAPSVAATVTVGVKLVARNKGLTSWVQLDDGVVYGTPFSLANATVEKTFAGQFKTTRQFNQVPFEVAFVTKAQVGTVPIIARIKNSSRINGEIVLGS